MKHSSSLAGLLSGPAHQEPLRWPVPLARRRGSSSSSWPALGARVAIGRAFLAALAFAAAAFGAAPARADNAVPDAPPEGAKATSNARVAYVGTTAKDVDADVVAAFEAGVEKALAATSIVVIHVPREARPRNPDGKPCVSSSCLGTMAANLGATHVVHGRLGLDPIQGQLAYSGSLEMIRIQPYQIVTAVPVACDRCIAKMLKAAVEVDTSALMGQFFDAERRQLAAATEAEARAAATKTAAANKPTAPLPLPPPPAARPMWPLLIAGAGVAALATGIVFIAMGERSTCNDFDVDHCGVTRRYRTPGIVTAAAGAAVAATGGLLFYMLPAPGGAGGEQQVSLGVKGTF